MAGEAFVIDGGAILGHHVRDGGTDEPGTINTRSAYLMEQLMQTVATSVLAISLVLLGPSALAQSQQSSGKAGPPPPAPSASTPATTIAPIREGSVVGHVVATPASPSRSSATGGNSGGGAQ